MDIYTWQYEYDVGKEGPTVWKASVQGPWYDDSEPEGQGATKEEAIAAALKEMVEIRDEINKLLAKPRVVEGRNQS